MDWILFGLWGCKVSSFAMLEGVCWIISSMGSSTVRSWLVSTIDSHTIVFVWLLTCLQGTSTVLAKRESTFVDYILLGLINSNILNWLPISVAPTSQSPLLYCWLSSGLTYYLLGVLALFLVMSGMLGSYNVVGTGMAVISYGLRLSQLSWAYCLLFTMDSLIPTSSLSQITEVLFMQLKVGGLGVQNRTKYYRESPYFYHITNSGFHLYMYHLWTT